MQKIITTLALAFAITAAAFAQQKVEYKKDMMTIDGVPVAKIETVDKFLFTESVSFFNLKGKELLFAKHCRVATGITSNGQQGYGFWWEIIFLDTKDKLEHDLLSSFSPVKDLVKFIGKNGLIKGDSIDSEAAKMFFVKYGGQRPFATYRDPAPIIVQQPSTTVVVQQDPGISVGIGGARINIAGGGGTATNVITTNSSPMAQRDRSGMPQVKGNQIIQGGVLVGTYSVKKEMAGSRWQTTVTVLFPNGQWAGQAFVVDVQTSLNQSYSLSTSLGGSREVNLHPGQLASFATVVINEMITGGAL
ncbi:MAG: hypothetical protein RI894_109 [Bacteroidota bacterium]|jgi:hypothetical protein